MADGWGDINAEDRRSAPVLGLDLRLEPGGWPETAPFLCEIEAHFAARSAENPRLWNGQLLLLRDYSFKAGVLAGAFRQTDFAAFTWWREVMNWRDLGMINAFALAAIEGSDGAFVLGVMGAHTAVPGRTYFPGGTPDPSDLADGDVVDLEGSVLRELEEETGLTAGDVAHDAGFTAVFDGPRIALLRRLVFPEPADALARRIRRFLARERLPELQDVVVVRSEDAVPAHTAPFALAYMRARWAAEAPVR